MLHIKGNEIRYLRLSLQIAAILLHTYFFIETLRIHLNGSAYGENGFHAVLFTLIIVIGCELASFTEAIIFVIMSRKERKHAYAITYLILLCINAFMFMTMAYYSKVETIICISFYAILFIVRIVNLVLECRKIFKA